MRLSGRELHFLKNKTKIGVVLCLKHFILNSEYFWWQQQNSYCKAKPPICIHVKTGVFWDQAFWVQAVLHTSTPKCRWLRARMTAAHRKQRKSPRIYTAMEFNRISIPAVKMASKAKTHTLGGLTYRVFQPWVCNIFMGQSFSQSLFWRLHHFIATFPEAKVNNFTFVIVVTR